MSSRKPDKAKGYILKVKSTEDQRVTINKFKDSTL
jgi:hypothetical protein